MELPLLPMETEPNRAQVDRVASRALVVKAVSKDLEARAVNRAQAVKAASRVLVVKAALRVPEARAARAARVEIDPQGLNSVCSRDPPCLLKTWT